ncbi:histone-lysine N-methyltransferase SETMAR [Trichonephila clavipes]|nr:histone-lysine N-methyltransferase SETMAR [Trichonephila clavipes]
MARRLGNWSCLEVRAMFRILWAKNVSASEIYSQIVEVYGEEAMIRLHVAKWYHFFQSGRQIVKNHNMAANGWLSFSTTEINPTQIEEMVQNDQLGLRNGIVQHIVSDMQRCSKTVL